MAQQPQVRRSIGVEAYDKYVELAKVLAFLANVDNADFHCAVGGEDSLAERLAGQQIDIVTIYSVYHHIRNKERFLADLVALEAVVRDARDGEPARVLRGPLVGVRGRAHQPRPRRCRTAR